MFRISESVMVKIRHGLYEARLVELAGIDPPKNDNGFSATVALIGEEGQELGETWVIKDDLENYPAYHGTHLAVLARTSQAKFIIHSIVDEERNYMLPCFTSREMAALELAKRAADTDARR